MLALLLLILMVFLLMLYNHHFSASLSDDKEGFYGGWRYGRYGKYPYFWRNYYKGYPYKSLSKVDRRRLSGKGKYSRKYYPYYNRYSYLPYTY